MIERNITHSIRESLRDTPVVYLAGAKQVGKSTLARMLAGGDWSADYLTLDDASTFELAKSDPAGFVSGLGNRSVIDEVQRVPGILYAIKASVDENRTPGRFLLTGSADILSLPGLAGILAGRMEVHQLQPLSQGELRGRKETFVDRLFESGEIEEPSDKQTKKTLHSALVSGGFPEPLSRPAEQRRHAWFSSYCSSVLGREARDLSSIENPENAFSLLRLAAARSASLLNIAELSRSLGFPQSTLKRYLAMLEALYLCHRLPSWHTGMSARMVHAPKLFIADTGLACSLLGIGEQRLEQQPDLLGPLLETFLTDEIRKQISWSTSHPRMFHFRMHSGIEVDLILEITDGRIAGIEVKAGASLSGADSKGLKALSDLAGDRFHCGVILYAGDRIVPITGNIHAVPMNAIWA